MLIDFADKKMGSATSVDAGGPEFNLKNDRFHQLELQINAEETQQTENLSDQQVIDLVENAIRSNPQDFPLLTKYYLNAA